MYLVLPGVHKPKKEKAFLAAGYTNIQPKSNFLLKVLSQCGLEEAAVHHGSVYSDNKTSARAQEDTFLPL